MEFVVNNGFFNKTKTKTKSCVPHGTKTRFFLDKVFFLSLYIKTHLWAYTWIE